MQFNLTRRWRSKRFNELVGQDLVVKLVKNSLYRDFLFPVYLLSGTRGCGKTSMGRLFATALNCKELTNFQSNPKSTKLPCLECYSCICMQKGEHPDFLEIDAASHTGVDNIRNIIESATYIPVLGNKRIFLIDEAHMLSKAAFNALLKILEEPPKSAIFMLATTDPHKILDTVKSRCFQLLFQPVDPVVISNHLSNICTAENIKFDKDALYQIALSSEGSIRDAINTLERLRLANNVITKNLVLDILGFVNESQICDILEACLLNDVSKLLNLFNSFNLDRFDSLLIWKKVIEILRTLIWYNQGIDSPNMNYINKEYIKKISLKISLNVLINMIDTCYVYESYLQRTSLSSVLLQNLFLSLASLSDGSVSSEIKKNLNINFNNKIISNKVNDSGQVKLDNTVSVDFCWDSFLGKVVNLSDSLLVSMFKQSKYKEFDKNNSLLIIELPSKLEFFKDEFELNRNVWQPILDKSYNKDIKLKIEFNSDISNNNLNSKSDINNIKETVVDNSLNDNLARDFSKFSKNNKIIIDKSDYSLKPKKILNFNDKEKWPKVNLLLRYFPGIVTEFKGA